MTTTLRWIVCVFGVLLACTAARAEPRVLTGWGGGKPDEVMPAAARVGFGEVVVHHDDAAVFSRFIELGRQHGIAVYAWLHGGDVKAWKAAHPDLEPPLQVMTEQEDAALQRILADKTPDKSRYQWGGEPVQELEVLTTPLLCFHDPRVLAFFQKQTEQMLAFEGAAGVAFDFIGYRNYHCCHCPLSRQLAEQYQREHPELSPEAALQRFSLESLVRFNNDLAAHVRRVQPQARVITHIYPLYQPEPLYGNRLDVDVCGQTAAWFFAPYWSPRKISDYTRVIVQEARRHHARPVGAVLIGYDDKLQPVKPAEQVRLELQAILDAGATRVHVCSLNSVLRQPDVAAVFAEFFAEGRR